MERCVNIDWLEVYALEDRALFPCDADYFRRIGYQVHVREYGTRVWREMFTLLDWHDEPLIEVRRAPASTLGKNGGLFPAESCHIRLSNRACYNESPIDVLRRFMVQHNYTLVKIYRIDICLDFERFDKGDDPAKFIDRYMRGKYSKINQCNISAHGVDQWNGRTWNSLSWGQPSSMVSTKMYCKTLELEQATDKPYIKYAWFQSHLIDDPINMTRRDEDGRIYKPDIYRVEFSIKSSAQKWFVIDKVVGGKGKIGMPHTLDMYDTRQKLLTIFASLANHYFHFKYFEPDKRKDRCRDKVLFDFSALDTFYKVDRLASHTAKTKPAKRLISLLRNYELTHPNSDVHRAVDTICEYIENEMLKNMEEYGTTTRDILILRRVIAERIAGNKRAPLAEHMREIESLLENNPELF